MNTLQIEDEIEMNSRIIKAAESWSKEYKRDPQTHSDLIIVEAKMERLLRRYFINLADRVVAQYIRWPYYEIRMREIQAADDFNVEVIVDDENFGKDHTESFIEVIYKPIEDAVTVGTTASQNIYGRSLLPGNSVKQVIQQTAKQEVGALVGKKVKDGILIDNPNAKYRVTDTTRGNIVESIKTSLSLGEDQKSAAARLRSVIADPDRAELIAQTEAVNGYQGGMRNYAKAAGAVAKEWQNVGATDFCRTNTEDGVIPIDEKHSSGHYAPAAHPRCRCSERYIWPEELEGRSTLTKIFEDEVGAVDLASIAQDAGTRPNADVNTKIELLLGSNKPEAIVESIRLAQTLPEQDAISMLRSINYNAKPVVNQYYTVRLNPTTKRIETVLKDPKLNPLKMTPQELAKLAGVPLPKE